MGVVEDRTAYKWGPYAYAWGRQGTGMYRWDEYVKQDEYVIQEGLCDAMKNIYLQAQL